MNTGDDTDLEDVLGGYAERISGALDTCSIGSPAYLYEAAQHPIRAGGKRLRPTMLLLVAEALGADEEARDGILPAALAVELVHTLSLIHDDVIDEDVLRRGEPAIHAKWDTSTAILAGDVLFPRAFETLLKTDVSADEILVCHRTLLRACRQLCEGQALDLSFEHCDSVTETEYLEMARLKTGALFAASARMGAVLAGHDDRTADRAAAYGRNLGVAYQLYDDVLDLTGETETLGKTRGSDVRQGKATLITIHARRHGVDVSVLANASDTSDEQLISELESSGSIAYGQKRATEYARTAKEFLDPFPKTTATNHLRGLAELVVNRIQ
jgi:geranylgeranyl diphosphate synthase type I